MVWTILKYPDVLAMKAFAAPATVVRRRLKPKAESEANSDDKLQRSTTNRYTHPVTDGGRGSRLTSIWRESIDDDVVGVCDARCRFSFQ